METLPTTAASAEKLKEIKELVDEVYRLNNKHKDAEKAFKEAKNRLANIMEVAEVDKMQGDSATASLTLKQSVSVPKDHGSKRKLFDYIRNSYGEEVLFDMLTINATKFSSWYTAEIEAKVKEGDVDFKLDMLAPYDYFSVGLRKRAGK